MTNLSDPSFPSFISAYDNALSKEECQIIIDEFEDDKDLQRPGAVGNNVLKPKTKISTDVKHNLSDNSSVTKLVVKCLNSNISKYTDEHPELNRELDPWSCTYTFNVQKYKPNEGFFKEHCEVTDLKSSDLLLVWMIYLNTVEDGGTIFPKYNIKLQAREGRLVIWPAHWTHLHKGEISKTKTKYITTGWIGFDDNLDDLI